eukprot:6117402-Amphidinium_carterae.1
MQCEAISGMFCLLRLSVRLCVGECAHALLSRSDSLRGLMAQLSIAMNQRRCFAAVYGVITHDCFVCVCLCVVGGCAPKF